MKPLAFLKRDFLIASSYKVPFLLQVLGIFFTMLIFFFVSRLVGTGQDRLLEKYGGNYFSFLLIGVAFTDYLLASVNSFADEIRKSQLFGTLEALLASPMSVTGILFSSSLFKYLFTTVRLAVFFLLGVVFFGLHLVILNWSALLIVFILTLISFWGIGMFSAGLVIIFKQESPMKWVLGPVSGLLGGIFYPIEVLPKWLQTASLFLPVTHSVEAMRLILLKGKGGTEVWPQISALILFAVILFPTGVWVFHKGLEIARRNGTLLHY